MIVINDSDNDSDNDLYR